MISDLIEPSPDPIDDLLRRMSAHGATDLLLTAGSAPLLRIDGQLAPLPDVRQLDADRVRSLVLAVLGRDYAERFERDGQVDFSLGWAGTARLRGNAYFQRGTPALSLRMIPHEVPLLEDLGLPEAVVGWTGAPRGLVLVTGPTGSGKSTSLAAMVDRVNRERAAHILTIEDPVEYVHEHKRSAVSQREVGTDTPSFASALRAALREDPDVVLVGEMRDPESIAAALTIAETGHLVMASLHTNDTAQTLDRIVDVFPAEQQAQVRLQLAHTLVGILNQRLIPKVGGGRVAAFEVLVGTTGVLNLIREGKTRQIRNMIATGLREGMQTLEASLSQLVQSGLVTYDEALLHTPFPAEVSPTYSLAR